MIAETVASGTEWRAEGVNDSETLVTSYYGRSGTGFGVSLGGLIQAATGAAGGTGGLFTKRSGRAA